MNDNTNVDGKKCSGCEEFKKFNDFYKDAHHPSGYKSECKECNRKRKGAKKFIPIIKNENGKECRTCGEFKSFAEFHKDKRQPDGHVSKCKTCRNERMKQYYEENKEDVLQRNAQYVEKNKVKVKKLRKKYYDANQEYITQRERNRWRENAEVLKEKKRQWGKTKQGQEAYYRSRTKRRSYKHKVDFTPFERTTILERDKWTCQSCGCKVHDRHTGDWNTYDKAHIDHIIPVSKGGNSEPSNLQVLCRTCNLSKQDKILNTI
jgi:5-methylcytosine-specific restriction endonuclease McrA